MVCLQAVQFPFTSARLDLMASRSIVNSVSSMCLERFFVCCPDSGDHLHTMSAAQLAAAMLAQPGQLAEMLTHERTGADQHASAVARFVGAEAASLRLGDIAELQAAYGDVAVAVLS